MTTSTPSLPSPLQLLRFGVRALRVTASTLAVVALLQRQWIPAAAFAVVWVLILQAPRVVPLLEESPADDSAEDQPSPGL